MNYFILCWELGGSQSNCLRTSRSWHGERSFIYVDVHISIKVLLNICGYPWLWPHGQCNDFHSQFSLTYNLGNFLDNQVQVVALNLSKLSFVRWLLLETRERLCSSLASPITSSVVQLALRYKHLRCTLFSTFNNFFLFFLFFLSLFVLHFISFDLLCWSCFLDLSGLFF